MQTAARRRGEFGNICKARRRSISVSTSLNTLSLVQEPAVDEILQLAKTRYKVIHARLMAIILRLTPPRPTAALTFRLSAIRKDHCFRSCIFISSWFDCCISIATVLVSFSRASQRTKALDPLEKPNLRVEEQAGENTRQPVVLAQGSQHTTAQELYRTAAERRAEGKALRDTVPREAHGQWRPPKGRRDPVELVLESNHGRISELIPIRHGRMLDSPFAFYRGSAALMAADLAHTPVSGLRVQACGDAHLMNFGGFATPERNVIFDINDLDETLPAPWEWDLKRLTASVVLAGRHLGLREYDSARAGIATVRAYREQMSEYAFMRTLDVWYDKIDLESMVDRLTKEAAKTNVQLRGRERLEKARKRSLVADDFPKLVEHHGAAPVIKDNPPLIYHPSEELAPGLKRGFAEPFAKYRESLPEATRLLFDRFHFFDLAIKVVGVGSVGTICGIALFMAADDDPLFIQIKEARASVLEPYAGKSLHENHGQRVVAGYHLMQSASDIFLGWSEGLNRTHYYLRQLRDMKLSAIIEDWDFNLLRAYSKMCAFALARAHARTGDAAAISGYMGSSEIFDDAICEFAVEYADQTERDYRAFVKAVRSGRVEATLES